jgi:hypothetical protein
MLVRVLHLSAPAATLGAARLDELLEALEVSPDSAIGRSERVAQLLLDALRHEVHLHHHPRVGVVEPVEGHHAGVVLAVRVAPGNPLVGLLLGDLRVLLVAGSAELGHPVHMGVVDLPDLLDAVHEARELLELVHWL